ncbi:DNA-3-methyladenine glycosylase 2 [Aquipuribacter nitratireducens]|uniref:DNA-3-methyladenine glycosylase II n=1 Tax=Aquipuribacter nitratireducens TaxID=650104 RepID=A0ABW0GMT9_9MICO
MTSSAEPLRLPVGGPLALDALRGFLAAHAVPGLERHEAGRHTRLVATGRGAVAVRVDLTRLADDAVAVAVAGDAPMESLLPTLRRWLGLDTDGAAVDAALARDPLLRPFVAARPGLRVPGGVDPFETAVLAVLGQQVSLAAARTFAGRLVAAFGAPGPEGHVLFPTPADLAAAGADRVRAATGVTGARARTVVALASAVVDGLVVTDPDALLRVPGIGPWTVAYVRMRAGRDPDAFLAGDLVLRRALGVASAAEALRRAEPWRPWRAYAAMHVWTASVPALQGVSPAATSAVAQGP